MYIYKYICIYIYTYIRVYMDVYYERMFSIRCALLYVLTDVDLLATLASNKFSLYYCVCVCRNCLGRLYVYDVGRQVCWELDKRAGA